MPGAQGLCSQATCQVTRGGCRPLGIGNWCLMKALLQLCSGRGRNGTGRRTEICHLSRRSLLEPVSLILCLVSLWYKLGLWRPPSYLVPFFSYPFLPPNSGGPSRPSGLQASLWSPYTPSKRTLRSSCPTGISTGRLALSWLSQGHLRVLGNQRLWQNHSLVTRHQPSSGLGAVSSLETCACKSTHLCWKPTWGLTFLTSQTQSRVDMITTAK